MNYVKRQSYIPDTASRSDSQRSTSPIPVLLISSALVALIAILLIVFSTRSPGLFQNVFPTFDRTSNVSHGEYIGETLENIRHEECEIVVAFDVNGRKLFEHTSNSSLMVVMPANLQDIFNTQHGRVLAHNHPGPDAPFSDADLALAADLQVQETIVVSAHYNYTMKPADTGWPDADVIADWFQELYERYPNDEELWFFTPAYDNKSDDHFTGVCTTDYLMELYVQEFGGTYTKSAIPIANQTLVDPPRD